MTSSVSSKTTVALAGTLVLAGACWVVAVRQMSGMDMGASTELGSFAFFIAAWVPMMAAMMLPGAVPAVSRVVRADGRVLDAPAFARGVHRDVDIDRPGRVRPVRAARHRGRRRARDRRRAVRAHPAQAAGAAAAAASSVRSGFEFGLYCVGSSIGLMVLFVALGVMSVDLDGRRRRDRGRPEALAAASRRRRAARAGDRRPGDPDPRRPVGDSGAHATM